MLVYRCCAAVLEMMVKKEVCCCFADELRGLRCPQRLGVRPVYDLCRH